MLAGMTASAGNAERNVFLADANLQALLRRRAPACAVAYGGRRVAERAGRLDRGHVHGGPLTRRLTAAGRAFFDVPPSGFADAPLLSPCPALRVGRADQIDTLDTFHDEHRRLEPTITRLDAAETIRQAAMLREDRVAGAILAPSAHEIDTAARHHGFLRGMRTRGGSLITGAAVTALARNGGLCQR